MKRNSLGVENLEQRTVLSASAVVAVDHLAAAEVAPAQTAVPQLAQPAGGAETIRVMRGDFNFDGVVDDIDIDMLTESIRSDKADEAYDLNGDALVDKSDVDVLVREIIGTNYGDLNLDGLINATDAGFMFENMFTETSGWAAGDFTGDGTVDGQDFVEWNEFKFTETKLGASTSGDIKAAIVAVTAVEKTETAPVKTVPVVNPVATTLAPSISAEAFVATNTVVEPKVVLGAETPRESPGVVATVASSKASTVNVADSENAMTEDRADTAVSEDTTTEVAEDSSIRLRFAKLRRSFR